MRSLMRAIWKRKLLAGALWLLGTALAVAAVQLLPAVYRAETIIRIESLSDGGVAPAGDPAMVQRDRLRTLRQQTLSNARVLELIRELRLYPAESRQRPESHLIEMARRDIVVELVQTWSRDRPGAFRVAFQYGNPQVAAAAANRLGALFVEENSQQRGLEGSRASDFLESQVQEAQRRLRDRETKLNEFKTRNAGQLPQEQNALLADLGRLQLQLQGLQDTITRTQQNKMLAETMLAAARQAEGSAAATTAGPAAGSPDPFEEAARKEADRLQKQLEALRLRYTDEHPEIRHTRQMLARVWNWRQKGVPTGQAQPAREPGAPAPPPESASGSAAQAAPQPANRVEALTAQRAAANYQLEALEAERKRLMEQIAETQAGISKLPAQQRELISLSRDYEIAEANYQFLLDRKRAAQMTLETEDRREVDSFSVLEPATAPRRPLRPDRRALYALGSAIALLIGLGAGIGVELKRRVILGEWEIPKEVAILGRIPTIRETARAGGSQRL